MENLNCKELSVKDMKVINGGQDHDPAGGIIMAGILACYTVWYKIVYGKWWWEG